MSHIAAAPATMPRNAETQHYKFNHTMIRIKDPKPTLQFYTEILGMTVLSKKAFSDFTLYFLGYDHSNGAMSAEELESTRKGREGVLELTHNHGTETDVNFKGYANGNSDPGRGFGHIAITVDNVENACARLERYGVRFQKKPNEGSMKGIAFVLDPDGYWVEIVPPFSEF